MLGVALCCGQSFDHPVFGKSNSVDFDHLGSDVMATLTHLVNNVSQTGRTKLLKRLKTGDAFALQDLFDFL
jgi:hypothetical protein